MNEMDARKFIHRITIQSRVESAPTDTGQRNFTWREFRRPWAEITSPSGQEGLDVRTINAQAVHLVRFRYVRGILLTHRILWGERILAINAVLDKDNRRREITLLCTEDLS